jgi:hypothetical protein
MVIAVKIDFVYLSLHHQTVLQVPASDYRFVLQTLLVLLIENVHRYRSEQVCYFVFNSFLRRIDEDC